MVTGYLKPDAGHILLDGRDITRLPPRAITRLGVARSFQIPQLFASLTVLDNMLVGDRPSRTSRGLSSARRGAPLRVRSRPAEAMPLLERFRLGEHRDARRAGAAAAACASSSTSPWR